MSVLAACLEHGEMNHAVTSISTGDQIISLIQIKALRSQQSLSAR